MRSFQLLMGLLPVMTLGAPDTGYNGGYGAPHAPAYDSYSAPAPSYNAPVQSYSAPATAYAGAPVYSHSDNQHVHHHYYHQAAPVVRVPVTPKPFVVQVPQNVPVRFVGVNVPTPAPQYQQLPVHLAPGYGYRLPDPNECYDFGLDCLGKIGRDFGLPVGDPHYGRYARQEDAYVKRKELAKSALLLGAGVVKGALITTLINQAQQNGK